MDVIGQIVGGQHAEILVRQKSNEQLELGELLVVEGKENEGNNSNANEDGAEKNRDEKGGTKKSENNDYAILQVFDLLYGSQIDPAALEMVSGLHLEDVASDEFVEGDLRNYVLAKVKAVVEVKDGKAVTPKSLPRFFSGLRRIAASDLSFLEQPSKPLFLGYVRSGSKILEKKLEADGEKILSNHVLVAASTGKGKSNALKVMLYDLLDKDYCGVLVLDPHNEYVKALAKHPQAHDRLLSLSPYPDRGVTSLLINYADVKPWHFQGVMPFSEAQYEAMYVYYKKYGNKWLKEVLDSSAEDGMAHRVHEGTVTVLQRRLDLILNDRVFKEDGGQAIVSNVVTALREGKKVLVDTSRLSSETELLVGSILANAIFSECKKNAGKTIAILIEEAPRVLGEGAGPNVFSSIAREGRKFGLGLIAVTQLASMIPREVLANLNTKIILGNEMKQEREALVGSAAQDLTEDSKAIAGLDKGEAIVSSVFTKFAVPIQVPLFEEYAKQDEKKERKAFV